MWLEPVSSSRWAGKRRAAEFDLGMRLEAFSIPEPSTGNPGTWHCAGAPLAWPKPASSSAASTGTCTWLLFGARLTSMSQPKLSVPSVMMSP